MMVVSILVLGISRLRQMGFLFHQVTSTSSFNPSVRNLAFATFYRQGSITLVNAVSILVLRISRLRRREKYLERHLRLICFNPSVRNLAFATPASEL